MYRLKVMWQKHRGQRSSQVTQLCLSQWASCQIHNIVGCACAGNAGNVFPTTAGKRSRHVSRHVHDARAALHAEIAFLGLEMNDLSSIMWQGYFVISNDWFRLRSWSMVWKNKIFGNVLYFLWICKHGYAYGVLIPSVSFRTSGTQTYNSKRV